MQILVVSPKGMNMSEKQDSQPSGVANKLSWEKPEFSELSTSLTEGGKGITGPENTTTSLS